MPCHVIGVAQWRLLKGLIVVWEGAVSGADLCSGSQGVG